MATHPALGTHRGKAAGIYWGTAFANLLAFGFPLLDVNTFPENEDGGTIQPAAEDGEADGWTLGSNRFISCRVPAIPPETETDPYGYGAATGYDTALGWREFFAWARQSNVLRFVPVLADYVAGDTTTYLECKLEEPWDEVPAYGWNSTRDVTLLLRAVEDSFVVGY